MEASGSEILNGLNDALQHVEHAAMIYDSRDEFEDVAAFLEKNWPQEEEGKSLDRSPKENWVDRVGGLPNYIERIAVHLVEKGMAVGHAIAVAVNAAKKMCATGDVNWPGLQQVNPGSRGEACAAVAEWEAKKAAA